MNILLIDSQELFSEGLKKLLLQCDDVTSVHIGSTSSCIDDVATFNIDMVICDMNTHNQGAFRIIDEIRGSFKQKIHIIILSAITDMQTVRQAIRTGANGYISKDTNVDELMQGIYEVQDGKRYISRKLRTMLMNNMIHEDQVVHHLSRREKEVLREICTGQTIKEIGYKMGLSPNTVQYYQRNLMKKLKVSRTIDLIIYAIQHGLYVLPARY
ncbi:LuxR C-terminal-related transcriptional regulator [Taibaiella chishuiensis]|uniref:DNA-binding NarL/FixJ family response regulator n=1 Tax=Taibaiella chishuiensis TaxID=1434707 RepID=A0A2P8DAU2_9BACT|nr:response regulator transcription factor [Taibaiella chishuiensis]PSK94307.1 DNA-binding NarL/FixJ family response regulator [Taibaiella chishuiensis]